MGAFLAALKVVPLIVAAVKSVETLFKKDPAKPPAEQNKERQDAAVEMTGDLLPLVEGWIGRDAFEDEGVKRVVRKLIDVIVELGNAVKDFNRRKLAAGVPDTPGPAPGQ